VNGIIHHLVVVPLAHEGSEIGLEDLDTLGADPERFQVALANPGVDGVAADAEELGHLHDGENVRKILGELGRAGTPLEDRGVVRRLGGVVVHRHSVSRKMTP
jgi:hypothetical protein